MTAGCASLGPGPAVLAAVDNLVMSVVDGAGNSADGGISSIKIGRDVTARRVDGQFYTFSTGGNNTYDA